MRTLILSFILFCSLPVSGAEKVKVRIVDRRDSESGYNYTVPQQVQSTSNTNVNCTTYPNSADCLATTKTTGTITPPRHISYAVHGATFSLLLADGRIVVVNCESKYAPRGDYINRRSCRMPIVDEIEVEFNKANAKLIWPVSIDGKKMESETYKIIGILTGRSLWTPIGSMDRSLGWPIRLLRRAQQ
jgi:hypothetical protein